MSHCWAKALSSLFFHSSLVSVKYFQLGRDIIIIFFGTSTMSIFLFLTVTYWVLTLSKWPTCFTCASIGCCENVDTRSQLMDPRGPRIKRLRAWRVQQWGSGITRKPFVLYHKGLHSRNLKETLDKPHERQIHHHHHHRRYVKWWIKTVWNAILAELFCFLIVLFKLFIRQIEKLHLWFYKFVSWKWATKI